MKLPKIKKDWVIITVVFVVLSLLFYGYFYLTNKDGLAPIYRNWDGPNYVIVARSFYDPAIIKIYDVIGLHRYYFAAHFPLYPVFIRLFSFIGYFQSSILVSQIFTLLSTIALYEFFCVIKLKKPLLLSLCFLVFSPRWFVVSHTGSSEPIFLFFFILFLTDFINNQHHRASIWAAFAQLVRSQGILIFAGISLYYLYRFFSKKINLRELVNSIACYLTIPLALVSVFTLYLFRYGNFFAFFDAIRGYGHLGIPYRMFGEYSQSAIIFPLEVMIFNYLVYAMAVFKLFSDKNYNLALLATPFLLPLPLLSHLDVSRYAIPLLPFVFVAYSEIFRKKYVLLALLLVIPAIMAWGRAILLFNQSI